MKWDLEILQKNSLGVAKPPYPDKQTPGALKASTAIHSYWVSSQTKYPEEAWRYIEWMTRPTGFFGVEFVSRGFGLLEFIDNNKYISDPTFMKILMISPCLSVIYPDPTVLNPDLITKLWQISLFWFRTRVLVEDYLSQRF